MLGLLRDTWMKKCSIQFSVTRGSVHSRFLTFMKDSIKHDQNRRKLRNGVATQKTLCQTVSSNQNVPVKKARNFVPRRLIVVNMVLAKKLARSSSQTKKCPKIKPQELKHMYLCVLRYPKSRRNDKRAVIIKIELYYLSCVITEIELLKINHNLLYQEIPVKLVSGISGDGSYRCIKIQHYKGQENN